MKTSYSHAYIPPAPVFKIRLAEPDKSPLAESFDALVDTGADATFVPTALLEKLDTPVIYTTGVRSHLGDSVRRVSVYKIDLLIESLRLPSVEVVGDDWGDGIILGRNALNKLRLLLDGPRQVAEVE